MKVSERETGYNGEKEGPQGEMVGQFFNFEEGYKASLMKSTVFLNV